MVLKVPEQNVEGKLGDKHKELIRENWQTIEEYAEEVGASSADLRKIVDSITGIFTRSENSRFERAMKWSFEKRLEARQRTEWLAQLEASNSPWNKVMDLAIGKIGKINRPAIAMSVLATKEKIEKLGGDSVGVAIENKVADLYTKYLNDSSKEASGLKFRNILPDIARQEGCSSVVQLLEKLRDEVNKEQTSEQISQITSEDIPSAEQCWKRVGDKLKNVGENTEKTLEGIKQKVSEITSKIKQSAPTVVRGGG